MKWIVLIALILFSCKAERGEDPENETTSSFPDQESWDATLIISNEGKKVGVVDAAHIEKYSKRNITLIKEGLKVDFFNDAGEHTSVLTSLGGEVNDNSQHMLAYGNVKVVSDSGMILYTDTLIWNNKKQKIISHVPVMIVSENDTLYGDSFISDSNLENYEITNSRGSSSKALRKQ